jgi:ribonuclease BN (tRNA processing enzyme)
MRFVLLGSGTTLPDPERGPAGFLVEHAGHRVLVDGGTGTIRTLARMGVDATTLSGGVYSHRHLDHCGDLAPLLFTFKVARRPDLYPIWAGAGFADYLDELHRVYPGWLRSERWGPSVTELPLDAPGEAMLPGGVRLETRPAIHGAGALHLRFTDPSGFRVVFSGDTSPSPGLHELAAGADWLVTECAGADGTVIGDHMWPEAVAELVSGARPRRVVLTHLYPETDPAEALRIVRATGVPTERGTDGMVLEG